VLAGVGFGVRLLSPSLPFFILVYIWVSVDMGGSAGWFYIADGVWGVEMIAWRKEEFVTRYQVDMKSKLPKSPNTTSTYRTDLLNMCQFLQIHRKNIVTL
jgi:hypothetical protein